MDLTLAPSNLVLRRRVTSHRSAWVMHSESDLIFGISQVEKCEFSSRSGSWPGGVDRGSLVHVILQVVLQSDVDEICRS